MREAKRLKELIVGGLGLGGHRAQLPDGSGQIALPQLCQTQEHAAVARVEAVTDCLGDFASFVGGNTRRDRVTGGDRCVGLPGQDLAKPPAIVRLPGEFNRLGEVLPSQIGVVGGGHAAGAQRPGQHGRVIDLTRERRGLLCSIHAVGSAAH